MAYNPKPFDFYKDKADKILKVVDKLFEMGQFQLAWHLYGDLLDSPFGPPNSNKVDAHKALYCLTSIISLWDPKKQPVPKIRTFEQPIIKNFTNPPMKD